MYFAHFTSLKSIYYNKVLRSKITFKSKKKNIIILSKKTSFSKSKSTVLLKIFNLDIYDINTINLNPALNTFLNLFNINSVKFYDELLKFIKVFNLGGYYILKLKIHFYKNATYEFFFKNLKISWIIKNFSARSLNLKFFVKKDFFIFSNFYFSNFFCLLLFYLFLSISNKDDKNSIKNNFYYIEFYLNNFYSIIKTLNSKQQFNIKFL
jgi:hypothetical protein